MFAPFRAIPTTPTGVVGSAYDVGVRLRLLGAAFALVFLAACGSGDGTRPTIPADASIVRQTLPPDADAGASPADTQPPEEPPAETAPAETAPPETQPAETQPAAARRDQARRRRAPWPPDDDGDDGTVWWPWVLAIVVLVAIVAIIANARRRRSGPSWQIRTTTLLDEIEQLTSHLAAITPAGLHAVAQSDAMRLATMRATLRDLIASAPGTNSQMVLNELTTPAAALHGAVDAIAMSADPSIQPDGASVSQLAQATPHSLRIGTRGPRQPPLTPIPESPRTDVRHRRIASSRRPRRRPRSVTRRRRAPDR